MVWASRRHPNNRLLRLMLFQTRRFLRPWWFHLPNWFLSYFRLTGLFSRIINEVKLFDLDCAHRTCIPCILNILFIDTNCLSDGPRRNRIEILHWIRHSRWWLVSFLIYFNGLFTRANISLLSWLWLNRPHQRRIMLRFPRQIRVRSPIIRINSLRNAACTDNLRILELRRLLRPLRHI